MKQVVVLLNLGGPRHKSGIQNFLFRLFNDPFILPYSKPFRWLLAQLISRLRAPKARKIYEMINEDGSSPLFEETEAQAQALSKELGIQVFTAMNYAPPYISDVVDKVYKHNPDQIVLLPLYPQYSMTTTQSALQVWFQAALKYAPVDTKWVSSFFDCGLFLRAHAELIEPIYEEAAKHGDPIILLSAHGLPVELVEKGDPYPQQVQVGASKLGKLLNKKVSVSYQSRVGPKAWLKPSTEEAIKQAGKEKRPLVVVPFAFVSEHSETLVELDIEYAELAHEAGVPFFGRAPSLGTHKLFIKALASLVKGITCPCAAKSCGVPDFISCTN